MVLAACSLGGFQELMLALSPPEESASFELFHKLRGKAWVSSGEEVTAYRKKSRFKALKVLYNLVLTSPGNFSPPPPTKAYDLMKTSLLCSLDEPLIFQY